MSLNASPVAEPNPPLRVLVVDDYPDAAAMTCELVRALGHTCELAVDGAGALARSRELHPDLVVLDIGLPDLSGYDVARQLRKTETEHPPVLAALTGWGQPADVARAAEAGFDRHVLKPATLAKVKTLLELAQRRRGTPTH
jgi:CheY-like chemotaxis protein